MSEPTLILPIRVIGDGNKWYEEVKIINETNIKIVFNDNPIASIACCGLHLQELAVGFLFAEGYIKTKSDVMSIEVLDTAGKSPLVIVQGKSCLTLDDNAPVGIASSGANTRTGLNAHIPEPPSANNTTIQARLINVLFEALITSANIHQTTRGTHSGAICNEQGLIVLREDIGRHNVADMLIGHALLNGLELTDKYIVRTGRVSLEIATKYRRAGIRILLSLSVPTAGAIEYANREGMCLVSSRRDGSIAVYTGYERLKQL